MTTDDTTIERDPELEALLRERPVPEPQDGFYDRAMARAMQTGVRRQRNRWLMTGFGSALAAGLAVWLIGGFLMTAPDIDNAVAKIPGVSIELEEPRTVNLVFSSATALDTARLTVTLPYGIELAGFPGQREISWETSLTEGRNLLPLKLIALTPSGGELLATLEHDDRNRTFRLQVDVT